MISVDIRVKKGLSSGLNGIVKAHWVFNDVVVG